MKKVGLVSNDTWMNKIKEDKSLKYELIRRGIDASIVSWQSSDVEDFDLLVLRSAWGYQNEYKKFKSWLLNLDKKEINILNNTSLILSNVLKDKQFAILDKNDIEHIPTCFLDNHSFSKNNLEDIINKKFKNNAVVIKPTISGSGENTFLYDSSRALYLPNTLSLKEIENKFNSLLDENNECNVMIQPYVPSIQQGEYSCIFIDGQLTHTMLRFPDVFHEKKKTYLVSEVPSKILELANKVEQIPEFSDYLYMRVDMVLDGKKASVMEVELTEPDLLTKYIGNDVKAHDIIKTFAKKIDNKI